MIDIWLKLPEEPSGKEEGKQGTPSLEFQMHPALRGDSDLKVWASAEEGLTGSTSCLPMTAGAGFLFLQSPQLQHFNWGISSN